MVIRTGTQTETTGKDRRYAQSRRERAKEKIRGTNTRIVKRCEWLGSSIGSFGQNQGIVLKAKRSEETVLRRTVIYICPCCYICLSKKSLQMKVIIESKSWPLLPTEISQLDN